MKKVITLLAAVLLSACYYGPYPTEAVSVPVNTYEQSWSAAVNGAQDAGVRITNADRASGVIRGVKPPMDVTITVLGMAEGRTQVSINVKGAPQEEGALTRQITDAYNRRMGR